MDPELVWEEEPKGKYYKFETLPDGRVVLEPVRVPAHIMEERQAQLRKKQRARAAQRNCQREMCMSRGFIAFIAAAVLICCFVCYLYVSLQSEVQERVKNISSLQMELEDLAADNDILENRIESLEDIIAIRVLAESELGMALVQQEQIVYYSVPDTDYMMQYEEVSD